MGKEKSFNKGNRPIRIHPYSIRSCLVKRKVSRCSNFFFFQVVSVYKGQEKVCEM